ncbi:hypothetical protein [Chitinophaga lutea]|uniref:hypothetical protein n=1 Tax=Chitinophaga lutea TaxID=2488634 RepID=UPI000F4D2E9C|nr:hypothetical protein [Chitinophaga lutea]
MYRIVLLFVAVLAHTTLYAFDTGIYLKSITFPANYAVGDYVEFVGATPMDAGASGNYEISVSYTRGNLATAATHLVIVSHANPNVWREAGRISSSPYTWNANSHAFTIDCNSEYGNVRFRVRAVAVLGISAPIIVNVKIRSINYNYAWTEMNNTGNDQTVNKFMPMTTDWSLYVGNPYLANGAVLGLKVAENGFVGIGTANPQSKLAVAGEITAQKVKVTATGWPDYVFRPGYVLRSLDDLESFIMKHQHLPDVPSEKEVLSAGIDMADMNARLLRKVEELTLYIIRQEKEMKEMKALVGQLAEKMSDKK